MGLDDVVANFTAQLIARGWTPSFAEYIVAIVAQLELQPLQGHDPRKPLSRKQRQAVRRAQSWLDNYADGGEPVS